MPVQKVCEICGKEFETSSGAKTCSPECRAARRKIICKKYNQEHKEWYNNYHRKYFQEKTKAKRREQYKDPNSSYRKSIEAYKEKAKQKRQENREKVNEYARNYRAAHPEAVKQYNKRYAEKNKDKYNAYMRERRQRIKLSVLPQITVEVDGKQLVLYECERLRIKGSHLPCGDRWECWDGTKCPYIPRGKEPKTFEDCVVSPQGKFNPSY